MLKDFTKEEFDIIIQAGQSNSEGTGYGDTEKPYEPNENVWYLNRNFTISLACEEVYENQAKGNFSLSFCDEYIKAGHLKDGRKLLILRTAVGGTGFSDNRWCVAGDLFLGMMEMVKTALKLNPKNKIVAFLWHQGEFDIRRNMSHDTYFNHITTLFKTVKQTYNCPELPFIAADFVKSWRDKNPENSKPISKALNDFCQVTENARFLKTDEFLSNEEQNGTDDSLHFSRDAQCKLGLKYFTAFENILGTKKG